MEAGFTLALDLDAERALLSGKIQTLIVCVYENERPHGGLLGQLDWRFRGLFSSFLSSGRLSGALGECALIPVGKGSVLAIGSGVSDSLGHRAPPSDAWKSTALKALRQNLLSLKRDRVGISSQDLGGLPPDQLAALFRDLPVWILQ